MSGLLALPGDCIAAIISLTSPRDACRFACVSAAESDAVWDHFLPPEYVSAIAESGAGPSSSPNESSLSKKELYVRACHEPVLVDQGKLSFWLDRLSGKKCYMIAPRELQIVWGDTSRYWKWISLPDARFPEVAALINVCWFEIRGKISTSLLSPRTTYAPYLVFKPIGAPHGFEYNPIEVTVGLAGSGGQKQIVYLDTSWQQRFFERGVRRASVSTKNPDLLPKKRVDGWLETELGEFFNWGDEEGELTTRILATRHGDGKHGLVFQGIEVRPKKETWPCFPRDRSQAQKRVI